MGEDAAQRFLTRRTQKTRRGLNSVAEENSSSEGTEKPKKVFSFAFFAASRETNLLSKSADIRLRMDASEDAETRRRT
jgi:hypothetical protein